MSLINGLSLRLTHKIAAIGIVGVILVGGTHLYGEFTIAPSTN